jgi:glycosyltransferase involved in cell wall biosynthesis
VVAYLRGLAASGHEIHLLTYETERRTRAEQRALEARLAADGLTWHRLRYHKRPSLLATVYDALRGVVTGARLVRRHRLDVVHARIHVPAATALLVRWLTGCRLVFDIRGLMAEEYIDAGRWRPGSLPVRLTKWIERRAIERADGIVVLTNAARRLLFGEDSARPVHVIPCCVDTRRFDAARPARAGVRRRLGLSDSVVLAYVGKFGGWYMAREMVDFFAVARQTIPTLHFLVLTQSDPELIVSEFERAGVPDSAYTVTGVPPEEVASVLSAADFAISFIRPSPSKLASSPTKLGEYLAAGLPVVTTAGVGGVDDVLDGSEVGVFVREFSAAGYESAAARASEMLRRPELSEACIALASGRLSLEQIGIPSYQALYRDVDALARRVGI